MLSYLRRRPAHPYVALAELERRTDGFVAPMGGMVDGGEKGIGPHLGIINHVLQLLDRCPDYPVSVESLTPRRSGAPEEDFVEQRHQLLFDQHLIPQGEYDRVQSEANALQDEISIAEANLEAARTGAKPEQLELANANITALQSEIEALKRRASTYILTAPISGIVTPTFSGDVLLTISAPEYVALIPVRWTDYPRVAATTEPRLTFRGLSQAVHGTLVAMNRELQIMNGQEVLIATGRLEAPPADVMPGMLVQCRIHCTPVTALDYGKQLLRSAAASKSLLGGL